MQVGRNGGGGEVIYGLYSEGREEKLISASRPFCFLDRCLIWVMRRANLVGGGIRRFE
jgi:hypothetical protein